MKQFKTRFAILAFGVALTFGLTVLPTDQAKATGWEYNGDGSAIAYQNGCFERFYTESFKLFGIRWATRDAYEEVCP